MGEQHHSYTGLLLIGFALLILLGAIFLTVAQTRVLSTDEYKSGNSKLRSASNWLIASYILGYIAGGVGLVLAILYFGHITWGIKTEVPHAILFILLFLLVLLSGIFGFVAMSEINNSGVQDKKGSENWIWAAEIAGLVAIVILIISGAWRAQYTTTKKSQDKMSGMSLPEEKPPAQFEFTAPSTIVTGGASSPSYQAPDLSGAALANSNNTNYDV